MNTKINEGDSKRALSIDFEAYAENDPDFKKELIVLMIDDLKELQQAFSFAIAQQDLTIFQRAWHKVKTTLFMLADNEFNAIVEELKHPGVSPDRVSLFNRLSSEMILSLSSEKN